MFLLDLTVTVPSDEWAYLQRRLKYLETLLLRVVNDKGKVREWFSATELCAKALPGLPASPHAIMRKAGKEGWERRKAPHGASWCITFHVSSLPARSFDALVARILDLPPIDAVVPILPDLPDRPAAPAATVATAENTAPPWVLPLMRIMKTETGGDITEAWAILPERLPPGVELPSVEEAAHVIVQLGLAGGG